MARAKILDPSLEGGFVIYFITDYNHSLVKIGRSTDPVARLKQLQCGSADILEIIAIFDELVFKETALHRRFKSDRLHGEWFRYSHNISKFLEDNKHLKITKKYKYRAPLSRTHHYSLPKLRVLAKSIGHDLDEILASLALDMKTLTVEDIIQVDELLTGLGAKSTHTPFTQK